MPHMIFGAAIGAWSPNYWVAFLLSLAGHFLVDTLPHWHYLPSTNVKSKKALVGIGLDFIVGCSCVAALAWPVSGPQRWIIFFSALVAILPDFAWMFYDNFHIKFFKPIVDFHHLIHREKKDSFWGALPTFIVLTAASIIMIVDKWP